jgi:hypothetical protein
MKGTAEHWRHRENLENNEKSSMKGTAEHWRHREILESNEKQPIKGTAGTLEA